MSKNSFNFRTKYSNDTGKYISREGTKLLAKYAMKVDADGYEKLVPTGEYINVYDKIQADYPSTDINLLMRRFALGETDVINVREGFYADVSAMPKTYAELFQMNEDAKKYFAELPTDVKELFDNSYTEFWSMMNENPKKFDSLIDEYNKRFELSPEFNDDKIVEPISESEVKADA